MTAFETEADMLASLPDAGSLLLALLSARASEAAAGNRRRLFAVFDEVLGGATEPLASEQTGMGEHYVRAGNVQLRQIRLRNWKSFERAELLLPEGEASRRMVVVNGQNGYGKSSLLEAIAFGLFGRQAVSDIGFLLNTTGGRAGQRRSYRALIERALHRSERARREAIAEITLRFEGESGPVELERRWYFDEDGALIEDDEELLLRVGDDRHLLETPEGEDPRLWYQAEIERRVIPAALAPFFLFDGEQVDRWAEGRLSNQVQQAIARLLGLHDLQALAEDLRDYARDRERQLGDQGHGSVEELLAAVEELEARLTTTRSEIEALDRDIAVARDERDRLLGTLAAANTSSHADLQAMLEDEHKLGAERERAERELIGVLADCGPLALLGNALPLAVVKALGVEADEERSIGLDPRDFEPFWERVVSREPVLDENVRDALRQRLLDAWRGQAADNGSPRLHGHLDRDARDRVMSRLRGAAAAAKERIADALAATRATRDDATRVARLRTLASRQAAECDAAKIRLGELAPVLEANEAARGALDARRQDVERQVERGREALSERLEQVRRSAPRAQAASAARILAASIDDHRRSASISEHERFGDAVTRSFRSLAHKGQISRIEIGADGQVELRDAAGHDVTDYRLSAGENQLFAMSLIAAVGELVGNRLPLFVDTPLGRLDTRHRGSVLMMLAAREGQTVLLTQPEEMTDLHIAAIRPALAGIVDLRHAIDDRTGVGVSAFEKIAS